MQSSMPTNAQSVRQLASTRERRYFLWLALASGTAYVIVFSNLPVALLATALHDDALYLRLGRSIASGKWLGAFDQFTLAKGPGYPIFLALVSWSGLGVNFAEALLLSVAIFLFCLVVGGVAGSYRLSIVLFLLTLWHPVFLTNRVLRDSIYTSLIILLLGLTAAWLFHSPLRRAHALLPALSGVVFGGFWLTREEGVWIIPPLVVLLLASRAVDSDNRISRVALIRRLAIAAICFASVLGTLAAVNRIFYGSFITVDFKERNFTSALNALQAINSGSQVAYLPVPRGAREMAYAVSPTAATLRPFLDPASSPGWQYGCAIYPETCGDIAGGWFVWALRDASAQAGYYNSPREAAEFFGKVAKEINTACAAGTLSCRSQFLDFMAQPTAEQYRAIPSRFFRAIEMLALRSGDLSPVPYSSGSAEAIALNARFLNGPPLMPPSETGLMQLEGWYYKRERGGTWLTVHTREADGKAGDVLLERRASPDLVSAFHDESASFQRFRLVVACSAQCVIELKSDDGSTEIVTIDNPATHRRQISLGTGVVHFDSISAASGATSTLLDGRARLTNHIHTLAQTTYRAFLPWLLALSLIAFAVSVLLAIFKRGLPISLCMAAVLWTLVASRVALLGVVDATSFSAVIPLYLIPAYYGSVLAAVLSLAAMFQLFRRSP